MSAEITGGTQTATLTTEHTLATDTSAKTYVLVVDVSNLADGETLELRAYVKVRSGSSSKQVYGVIYRHTQSIPVVMSPPIVAPFECKVTLKQTGGTGRSYDWSLDSP